MGRVRRGGGVGVRRSEEWSEGWGEGGLRGRGGVRWKVEGGNEGERGGKSRHGTSTHHQFFVVVETDDGGQFLSRADGLPGNVAVHVQPVALQSDSQPVSL